MSNSASTVAATGMARIAPDAPNNAAPSITEANETAGWTSTALALIRGSIVRFSTCW